MDRWLAALALAGRRRALVVDLGCGFGALGLAMAVRAPGLRVLGLDLDGDLVAAGRRVADAAGLAGRVRLLEAGAEDPDAWDGADADAVVTQAVLVHTPRPARWLGAVLARCRPGTAVGLVEPDRVAAAEGLRDAVAEERAGYVARRVQVARALARGAEELFGMDRRVGRRLAQVLRRSGAAGAREVAPGAGAVLEPPYDPGDAVARWMRARIRRRLDDPVDDVELQVAAAGGLDEEEHRRWIAERRQADRRRLERIERGTLARDERAGWAAVAGRVSRDLRAG